MVDLSIVIVSWNTRELLQACLTSLYKYTSGITFEVFVVDNASSDGSVEMVRDMFPLVNLIAKVENVGFSKANNQAIRISKGRYIALLNPDTLLIEDVFSALVKYADEHGKTGAIGPKILCKDGKTIQYNCARKLPNLFSEFCRFSGLAWRFPNTKIFNGEYMSYDDYMNSKYVESLVGACMVVRKRTIDNVGLMDENQFMYGDEIDWCKRILDAGWDIYYYADISIIHYGGESAKQIRLFSTIESVKAKWYFYKKHKGKLYAYLFYLQVFAFSLSKYIWSTLFRSKNDRIEELKQIYKNKLLWSFKHLVEISDYKDTADD